jgi:hypothetical protein
MKHRTQKEARDSGRFWYIKYHGQIESSNAIQTARLIVFFECEAVIAGKSGEPAPTSCSISIFKADVLVSRISVSQPSLLEEPWHVWSPSDEVTFSPEETAHILRRRVLSKKMCIGCKQEPAAYNNSVFCVDCLDSADRDEDE